MSLKRIVLASPILVAACTSNPGVNMTEGAVGGAAIGCGIGAAVTAPLLGVGCVPGAIIGAASGGGMGLATTQPPATPSPYAYPPSPPPPGYYP